MKITCSLKSFEGTQVHFIEGDIPYLKRVEDVPIDFTTFREMGDHVQAVGVSDEFKKIIHTFNVSETETPAGFKVEFLLDGEGILRADLKRDIGYGKNGIKRPTGVLFSADSANPYEVAPIKNMIANLTCNPGIIYDLFINNPQANVGGKFKSRDEVMAEIGNILGSGADISVELNDPFGKSDTEILEEAHKFKEMLSEYRVVIKVPHTGPVNKKNVGELLKGEKTFGTRYDAPPTADALRGHNIALMLEAHGFRVNFTLMFEPYQTALALQAKPYFINSFVRHRFMQSEAMAKGLAAYGATDDPRYLEEIRKMFSEKDYLCRDEAMDLLTVKKIAEDYLKYRCFNEHDGSDGLDAVRHNLRWLKHTTLQDTRLIICSMEGPVNYPDIDKLLVEKEFKDMADRVVITAEPSYLARFTSCNQVISYQRRFMNAAKGAQ